MYTWKTNWIYPNESPWGIINKFLLSNSLYGNIAVKELTTGKRKVTEINHYNNIHTGLNSNYEIAKDSWLVDDESIEEYGIHLIEKLLQPLLLYQNKYYDINSICNLVIRKQLFYCPECMKNGLHLMQHQFTFTKKCHIHNINLTNTCSYCRNELPYIIEFGKNIYYYNCKHCGFLLYHTDNFGKAIESWTKPHNDHFIMDSYSTDILPVILSNDYHKNLSDKEINETLLSILTNSEASIKPKCIIKNNISWTEINFGNIINSNISRTRKIEEYSYIYAFQKLYRHKYRSNHVRHKIHNVEKYIKNCCSYYHIMSKEQIDLYLKHVDLNAISIYLWKRDMEFSDLSRHHYQMNKRDSKTFTFEPDYDIINYIKKISYILSNSINENSLFSILVHICTILMNDRYKSWIDAVKNLFDSHDKYGFTQKISRLSLKEHIDLNKEFLLLINNKEQIYKLYYESGE